MKEGYHMSEQQERVSKYVKQLEELGYRSFQIDEMLRDAVGTAKIDNLSQAQLLTLEESLQECVSFALKCKGKTC